MAAHYAETISATDTVVLGAPSEEFVGKWVIAFDESAGGNVSIVVQGKPQGQTLVGYQDISYTDVGGAGSVTAAGTAIAADAIIFVDAHAMDVQLVVTVTTGSVGIAAHAVEG